MGIIRRVFLTTVVTAPPALYVYSTVNRLEAQYPRLEPLISSTTNLRMPSDPNNQHTPHVDIYSARVPAKLLSSQHGFDGRRSLSLDEAWARFFLQSPILQLEAKILGGFTGGPGDAGQDGFRPGQKLLNGTYEVVRPPTATRAPATPAVEAWFSLPNPLSSRRKETKEEAEEGSGPQQPGPLLVRWEGPRPLVAFIGAIALHWEFPFRLMSGGRHEYGVGEVDRDGMVEVRFASAHDYEWMVAEGDQQKTVPPWAARLHRAFSMWLLDERVRALRESAGA